MPGGELHTGLADGRTFILAPGMGHQVADEAEPHRSSTESGATLFIADRAPEPAGAAGAAKLVRRIHEGP